MQLQHYMEQPKIVFLCEEMRMRSLNERRHAKADVAPRVQGEMSEDTKMGILLVLIGLVAFSAYAVFYLIGFVSKL